MNEMSATAANNFAANLYYLFTSVITIMIEVDGHKFSFKYHLSQTNLSSSKNLRYNKLFKE